MSPDDKIESQEQFEEISRASLRATEEVREIALQSAPASPRPAGLDAEHQIETIDGDFHK